jgi:hypothetical protein
VARGFLCLQFRSSQGRHFGICGDDLRPCIQRTVLPLRRRSYLCRVMATTSLRPRESGKNTDTDTLIVTSKRIRGRALELLSGGCKAGSRIEPFLGGYLIQLDDK